MTGKFSPSSLFREGFLCLIEMAVFFNSLLHSHVIELTRM